MRKKFMFGIAAACAGWAAFALLQAQVPHSRVQLLDDHAKWVESCLKDFDAIKPGMTRGQIEAELTLDGGLQRISPVRFAHPACRYFKIDVEFEFKRNGGEQDRAIEDTADKVTAVSRPYIERPFID